MNILENEYFRKAVSIIFTIVINYFIYRVLKSIFNKLFSLKDREVDDSKRKMVSNIANNFVKYFIIVITFLTILETLGIDTKALIASLGVIGLVTGLAVQDTIKDFVAGITIIFQDQYRVGDVVKINGFRGEVISHGIKTTRIKAYTGEVMILPNHLIESVINYSRTNSLVVVDVSIAYESDIDKTIKVLEQMCDEIFKDIKTIVKKPEVLGVQQLSDSSVDIRVVCETKPLKNFDVEREIKKRAKEILDKNSITIPYPQVVVHNGKRV